MIGSEILKNAGIKPTRPTVFNCLDLDLQSKIAKASTDPHQHIIQKYTQNGVVNVRGIACTANLAAALTDNPL